MIYSLKNGILEVTVSTLGAELQSIDKDGIPYLWDGRKEFWENRAPLLFPFVGRLTDGKYILDGREYSMDIHGFANKMEFQTVERTDTSVALKLEDSAETLRQYPYCFTLLVTIALEENRIRIFYDVSNRTDHIMYFGIGGHPGFRVPLEPGLEFSDYYLEFDRPCRPDRVGHTKTCFLSGTDLRYPLVDGRKLLLRHNLFDDDAIVLKNIPDRITLKSDKGKRQVIVSYPYMPYLGIWHADFTEAPYVCIEPWTSLPSRQDVVEDFACKADLNRLPAGKMYHNEWSVEII